MTYAFRPGPDRLRPGLVPNGLVFRVYDRLGSVLLERRLDDPTTAALLAPDDADLVDRLAGGRDICLVVFDGDTGARWTPEDWRRAGYL